LKLRRDVLLYLNGLRSRRGASEVKRLFGDCVGPAKCKVACLHILEAVGLIRVFQLIDDKVHSA
jgi:hypothetical protein